MESNDSDELNALSPQVFDYCQKHSQTRNLSSYFRGVISNSNGKVATTSVRQTEDIESSQQLHPIGDDDNNENNISTENVIEDQCQVSSPSSSVISNRKLEWDNLGDIGYGNYVKPKSLHKSLSLPVLTTLDKINLAQKNLSLNAKEGLGGNGDKIQTSLKGSSHESSSTDGNKKVSSLTSTNTASYSKQITTVSDTTSDSCLSKFKTVTTETDLTDIEYTVLDNNVINLSQKYVGLPMAESTPNSAIDKDNLITKNIGITKQKTKLDGDFRNDLSVNKDETSNVLHKEKPAEIELKCVATCLRSNIKHLSLTKPIVVECYNYKKIYDKDIQTSILITHKKSSVATQTEKCVENDQMVDAKIYPVYDERRVVEFIKYGDSPQDVSVRSLGTNTGSSRISQGDSLEHLYDSNLSEPSKYSNKSSVDSNKDKHICGEGNSKRSGTSDNEKTISCIMSDNSSIANSLTELITTKLSKHVIGDVEKSIGILQKLLKSKKYDTVTKQYYVKKIVQKIVNCNYSSESSANSEVPTETTNDNDKNSDNKIENFIEASTSRNEYQEAVPQKPIMVEENKIIPKQKRLEIKTFATEILPEEYIMDRGKCKHTSKVKDARFTITANYNKINLTDNFRNIGDTTNTLSPVATSNSPIESSSTSDKTNSFKNWKDNMTKSEMLLEEKINKIQIGDGSSNSSELLNFAKKERENQINWINNEISHLNKLKDMLQKKEQKSQVDIKAFTEPRVEDMTRANKTTSVYVITTQKSNVSSSSTYGSSVRSSATKGLGKKCECLFSKTGSLPCDSSDCPLLNFGSDKSFKTNDFNKMLKKDIRMLPHLANFPEFQSDNDIENAKLIANEVYPGHTPHTSVRRFVFEVPLNLQNDLLKEKYERLLREQKPGKPFIPELPDCNINMDSQNAKLLASEICEGPRPNTCVRRYVFEIPVRDDDVYIGKSSKSTRSSSTSYRKRESASSKCLSSQSKCKCKTKQAPKSCVCNQAKESAEEDVSTVEIGVCDLKRRQSSDVVCICKVDDVKKDERLPCDVCKKIIKTDICPESSKKYRVCVGQIGTADSDCKCECTCVKCKNKLHHKERNTNDDYSSSDDAWGTSERKYKKDKKPGHEKDKKVHRFKGIETIDGDNDIPDDDRSSIRKSHARGTDPKGQELSVQTTVDAIHDHKLSTTTKDVEIYEKPTLSSAKRGIHLIISCGENGHVMASDGNYIVKDIKDQPKKKDEKSSVKFKDKSEISSSDIPVDSDKKQHSKHEPQSETDRTMSDDLSSSRMVRSSLPIKHKPKTGAVKTTRYHDFSSKQANKLASPMKYKVKPGLDKKAITSNDLPSRKKDRLSSPIKHKPKARTDHKKTSDDKRKDKQLSSVKHRPKSRVDDKIVDYLTRKGKSKTPSPTNHRPKSGTDGKTVFYYLPDDKKEKPSSPVSYAYKLETGDKTTPDNFVSYAKDRSSPQHQHTFEGDDKTTSDNLSGDIESRLSSRRTHKSTFETDDRTTSDNLSDDIRTRSSSQSKHKSKSGEERTTSDNDPVGTDKSVSIRSRPDKEPTSNKNQLLKTDTKSSEQRSSEDQSGATEMLEAQFPTSQIFKIPTQPIVEQKRPLQNIVLLSPEKPHQLTQSTNTDEIERESEGDQYGKLTDGEGKYISERSKKREARESRKDEDESTSSSSYLSDSTDSSDSSEKVPRICLCCNRAEAKFRSKLRGLPYQLNNALCDPCYITNRQADTINCRPHYTYPGHVCNCYTVMKTETVRNIQRTVQELEDLERDRDFCSCSYGYRMQKFGTKRGKYQKSLAYTLTFEDVEKSASDEEDKKRRKSPMNEIRIKIPKFVKKSHKDRVNQKRTKHEKRNHRHHRKDRNSKTFTLQDHLVANRPNFIASAEERRKAMIELAYMREERCQKYKQLLAMSNGILPRSNIRNKSFKPRMFTSKEMKEMTAKHYKRLPEVQKRFEDNRNEQIKKANKILTNIFNKRLQDYTLKGKINLSTSTSVIKLPSV